MEGGREGRTNLLESFVWNGHVGRRSRFVLYSAMEGDADDLVGLGCRSDKATGGIIGIRTRES